MNSRKVIISLSVLAALAGMETCVGGGQEGGAGPVPGPAGDSINVDFSVNEYYPLVKERIGLFEEVEVMHEEKVFIENLSKLRDLPASSFRSLLRFEGPTVMGAFNRPDIHVYEENGVVKTRTDANMLAVLKALRGFDIVPILSFYGTPNVLRADGKYTANAAVPPTGFPGAPKDVAVFAEACSELARLYAEDGPLVFEVLNEPNWQKYLDVTGLSGYGNTQSGRMSLYNEIYAATANLIKKKNPDILIGGPSSAEGRTEINKPFVDYLRPGDSLVAPLDYYIYHSYGNLTMARVYLNTLRSILKDNFQTVPFLITEYENYTPSDTQATKRLREKAVGAVQFMRHVKQLTEWTDIAAVNFNRYMNFKPDTPQFANANRGGFLSYTGEERAIYHAFKLYGRMPAERGSFVSSTESLDGFASSDNDTAAVMFWNDTAEKINVTVNMKNIPAAVAAGGSLDVYRVDAENASAGDGSAVTELIAEDTKTLSGPEYSLNISIPAPGIVALALKSPGGRSIGSVDPMPNARYVRTWQFTDRGSDGVPLGDYGTFDPKTWTLRAGTLSDDGRGIAGVVMDNAPENLSFSFTTREGRGEMSGGVNILVGLRVDYLVDGVYVKNVLLHGGVYNPARDRVSPWGKASGRFDEVLDIGPGAGNGQEYSLNLDAHAPQGWSKGPRRCIVTLHSEGERPGSQSVVRLWESREEVRLWRIK
ncbi:MAG: hypothetical protein LBT87_03610 [Treponema sp.]|jgi:hypothetical protein|nr:hypothetical protein [Treponema sp.]